MNEIIRFFRANPVIVLVVVVWVLSAISSARQAIAKARAEAEKRARGAGAGPPAAPRPVQRPEAKTPLQPDAKSPQQIAEAIRRAMGLGGSPSAQPPPSNARQTQAALRPKPAPREPAPVVRRVDYDELPQRPVVDDASKGKRRTLAQEMQEKVRIADEHHLGTLADRMTDLGSGVRERKLALHVGGGIDRRAHRRRPSARILDLSRPASAFIASEVFGRPLALRDEFDPPSGD